jgi:murein DD-endopeptidase MepM/ murein hydrolase activator NlpD
MRVRWWASDARKERIDMSDRTFRVESPHMQGDDIRQWQKTLNRQFGTWKVNFGVVVDGDYGVATRDATATVLYGLGIARAAMKEGVPPKLRIKVRNGQLTATERGRYDKRAEWRKRLRERHKDGGHVAPPLAKIISSSWGWTPPVHDGVDLICKPNATLYALCDAKVIDVRSSGWWGKAPTGDVRKGDGIIQLECRTDVGPFKRGMHFGYGHAEHATVRVGQIVKAGEPIGKAGLAVAWHVHFMANAGNTSKGIGDRDPMPFVSYAMKKNM